MAFGFSLGFGKNLGGEAGTFTLSNLFKEEEVGVMFDPSTLGTMFQSSALSNPTLPGDTAGIILDQSQWGGETVDDMYGPEMVVNGWEAARGNSVQTVENGVVHIKGLGANTFGASTEVNGLVVGCEYEYYLECAVGTTNDIRAFRIGRIKELSNFNFISIGAASVVRGKFIAPYETVYMGVIYTTEGVSGVESTVGKASMREFRGVSHEGPNILLNGGFSKDTSNWISFSSSLSWGDGTLTSTSSGGFSGAYQSFPTIPGQTYTVSGELKSADGFSDGTHIRAGDGAVPDAGIANSPFLLSAGSVSFSFKAISTESYVYLRNTQEGDTVWDNISVRKMKSQNILSSELITNPDFSVDSSGWSSLGSSASWSEGALTVTGGGVGTALQGPDMSIKKGRIYTATVRGRASALSAYFNFQLRERGSGATLSNPVPVSLETFDSQVSFTFIPTASSNTMTFVVRFSGGEEITLDSVSIKEVRGNHAIQDIASRRPLHGIRPKNGIRNLLSSSNISDYTYKSLTIARYGISPLGEQTTNVYGNGYAYTQCPIKANSSYTFSFFCRKIGSPLIRAYIDGNSAIGSNWADFDLDTGDAVSRSPSATTVSEEVYPGIWRVGLVVETPSDLFGDYNMAVHARARGDGGTEVWGMQCEEGTGLRPYQQVVSSQVTLSDSEESLHFMSFDGVDDTLSVSGLDMSETDEVSIFTGFDQLRNSTGADVIFEYGNDYNSDGGSFIFSPSVNVGDGIMRWGFRSTIQKNLDYVTTRIAPFSATVYCSVDISENAAVLHHNGKKVAETNTNLGSGNFGNYPLFIGSRSSGSLWLQGAIYALIIRGKTTGPSGVAQSEKEIAIMTGIQL
jgi:hypothetical protein